MHRVLNMQSTGCHHEKAKQNTQSVAASNLVWKKRDKKKLIYNLTINLWLSSIYCYKQYRSHLFMNTDRKNCKIYVTSWKHIIRSENNYKVKHNFEKNFLYMPFFICIIISCFLSKLLLVATFSSLVDTKQQKKYVTNIMHCFTLW